MTAFSNRYRPIWLSDLHLGSSAREAKCLLDFMRFNPVLGGSAYQVALKLNQWCNLHVGS